MSTPRIEIDLAKITRNAGLLADLYGSRGIGISAVTKVCLLYTSDAADELT